MFFFTATRLLPPIADELSIKENIGRSICTVNDGNQLITMEGTYRKRAPFQNVQTFSISAESRRWKEMKVLRFQWVITQSPHRCAAVASKGAASQLKRRRDQRKERWFSRGNQVFWQSWWNQRSPLMTPVFNIQRCHTQDKATSTYWLSSHANLVVSLFCQWKEATWMGVSFGLENTESLRRCAHEMFLMTGTSSSNDQW